MIVLRAFVRQRDCQSRFIHAQIDLRVHGRKRSKHAREKVRPIRRVNAINESARITCPATRLLASPSPRLASPRWSFSPWLARPMSVLSPVLPCARIPPALVKPSVAINSPLALTVDAGHDIRNVGESNVFVLSTATSDSVCESRGGECRPAKTSFARRFLICEPDETVDSS